MMAFEILYGKVPWPIRDIPSFLWNIYHVPLRFPYDKSVSEEFKDFIRSCLTVDESKRIGWDDVFSHPFLKRQ